VKKWKSVHVVIAADRLLVAHHLVAHHLESLQAVALHPHHGMNVQLVVVEPIAQELHVKFLKVAKSLIHAGLGQHLKSAINREFAQESLSQIFQKMSPVKNLRRASAQNF
jgi:hypothetical protein